VDELSGVAVFYCFQKLVDNILLVNFLQDIRPDHSMQICFHIIENNIDILVILSSYIIPLFYYVLMV